MSLGDYLRFQRALHGGPGYIEISQVTGIPSRRLKEMEMRQREVSTEEDCRILAQYYGVPLEKLLWLRQRTRKMLTALLQKAQANRLPVRLLLRSGEVLSGYVRWFDLTAVALEEKPGAEPLIVQRHVVEDWEILSGEG